MSYEMDMKRLAKVIAWGWLSLWWFNTASSQPVADTLSAQIAGAIAQTRQIDPPYWPHNQVYHHQRFPTQSELVSEKTLLAYFLKIAPTLPRLSAEDWLHIVDIRCSEEDFSVFVDVKEKTAHISAQRLFEIVPFRNSPRFWDQTDYSPKTILRDGGVCTDRSYVAAILLKLRGVPTIMLWGENHFWYAYKEKNNWQTAYEQGNDAGMYIHPVTGIPTTPIFLKRVRSYKHLEKSLYPWTLAQLGRWEESIAATQELLKKYPENENLVSGLLYPLYFYAKTNGRPSEANKIAALPHRSYRDIPLSVVEKIVFSSRKEE